MNADFYMVKLALLNQLTAGAVLNFTGQATANSATILMPSSVTGLFAGVPVAGIGTPAQTTIAAVADDGSSITLSQPMTADTVDGDTAFVAGFVQTGPRSKRWNMVAEQPAMFLRRVGVHDDELGDGLIRTAIDFEAWVYSNAGQDPDVDPDVTLSALEQLVRNALNPALYPFDEDEGRFTLATALRNLNLNPQAVYWCRVTGHSPIFTGDQGSQAIARIPIRVTLP